MRKKASEDTFSGKQEKWLTGTCWGTGQRHINSNLEIVTIGCSWALLAWRETWVATSGLVHKSHQSYNFGIYKTFHSQRGHA